MALCPVGAISLVERPKIDKKHKKTKMEHIITALLIIAGLSTAMILLTN